MKRWFVLLAIMLMLAPLTVMGLLDPLIVWAAGPVVATKGLICFNPNPETDILNYTIYQTNPNSTVTTFSIGKPTAAPVPPAGANPCNAGSVGVLRDQTGQPDGQYSIQATATNTSAKESAKSTAFTFILDGSLNLVAPGAPVGLDVK